MAKFIGISSTYMSQIIKGTRDISNEQAFSACKYIGLVEDEREYFLQLVHFSRAGTEDLRRYHLKKMKSLKADALKLSAIVKSDQTVSEADLTKIYSNWIHIAVMVYSHIEKLRTPTVIARQINLPIEKIQDSVALLSSVGAVEFDGSRVKPSIKGLHLPTDSPLISYHHTSWRHQAISAAPSLNSDELMFTGPLSISEEGFSQVREVLRKTIRKVSNVVKCSDSETAACLNIDFFRLNRR